MTNHPPASEQRQLLAVLIRGTRGLNAALMAQSIHLQAGEFEAMDDDNRQVETRLSIMSEYVRRLQHAVGVTDMRQLDARMNAGNLARSWRRLVDLMRLCDRQNQLNGMVLNQRQLQMRKALETIVQAGSASLYGRAGRQDSAATSSRLLGLG